MNEEEDGTGSSISSSSQLHGGGVYSGAIVSTTLWRELCQRVAHTAEIEEIRHRLDSELIDANEELMGEIQRYTEILDDIRGRVEDHLLQEAKKKNSFSSLSKKDYTHERRHRQAKLLQQQISYFVQVLESRGIDPASSAVSKKNEQQKRSKEELLKRYKKLEVSDTDTRHDDTQSRIQRGDQSPQRVSSATRSRESPQGSRSRFKRRLYEDLAACSGAEKATADTGNRRPSTASSRPTTASSMMDLSVSSAPNMLDNLEEHLNAFNIDTVATELKQALQEEYKQLSEERQHLEQQVLEETMLGASSGAFASSREESEGARGENEEASLNEMKALKAELQQQYLRSEQESVDDNTETENQSKISDVQRRHLEQITSGLWDHYSDQYVEEQRIPTSGRPGTAAGIDKELDELFDDNIEKTR